MPNVQLGQVMANLDIAERPDQREVIRVFFDRNPDILDWCRTHLQDWDEKHVITIPTYWGRHHVEYTVELRDLKDSDALAARLRFS